MWAHYGRPPKYQEMNKTPSAVGGKAYVTRWGTWNRAVHAFTDYVESEAAAPSAEHGPREPKDSVSMPTPRTAESPPSDYAIECYAAIASAV